MLYYTLKNDRLVSEIELHKAYEVATGETFSFEGHAYEDWLNSLMGKSIVSVRDSADMTIVDFLEKNALLDAIKIYRERHVCSLAEAREVVGKIWEQMNRMEPGS